MIVHDGGESLLYDPARRITWDWLTSIREPATSTGKVPDLGEPFGASPAELAGMVPPTGAQLEASRAPVLLPSTLDVWTRTSPQPVPDVPVAPFLHGHGEARDEVRLVWRADLLGADAAGERSPWMSLVEAVPPLDGETLEVPLAAFRRWIKGAPAGDDDAGDLLSIPVPDDEDASVDGASGLVTTALHRPAGADVFQAIELPRELWKVRPDDLVVLPADTGGCDGHGWAPGSTDPVPDIADLVRHHGRLRIAPFAVLQQTCAAIGASSAGLGDLVDAVLHALAEGDIAGTRTAASTLFENLPSELADAIGLSPQGPGRSDVAVIGRGSTVHLLAAADRRYVRTDHATDVSTDPAATSYSAGAVDLATHLEAVGERARSIADRLGLPDDLRDAVVFASRWHDVGKLDRRFQVMLTGGDELAADVRLADDEPLAKSGFDPADRSAWIAAFRASGLPNGFRHEVGSAVAARAAAQQAGLADLDLVEHLVGSHHGRGRPLYPPVADTAPPWELNWQTTTVKVDPGQTVDYAGPRRFHALNQRYGRWGLALLEAVVRLADIGCSEEGT